LKLSFTSYVMRSMCTLNLCFNTEVWAKKKDILRVTVPFKQFAMFFVEINARLTSNTGKHVVSELYLLYFHMYIQLGSKLVDLQERLER